MSAACAASVVVAIKGKACDLDRLADALRPERWPDIDFLFCFAGAPPAHPALDGRNVTTVAAAEDSLVPHLWRDGIRRAKGERVALLASHCLPSADWVERAAGLDFRGLAAIGGAIENAPGARASDCAAFLLRFLKYAPPLPAGPARSLAADNAVYLTAEIMRESDLLVDGFWENLFHERFLARGLGLALAPELIVAHHGGIPPMEFAAMRFRHGRHFGRTRTAGRSLAARLGFLAAAALVPPLYLLRIGAGVLRRPHHAGTFVRALGWLILFILAWSAGEWRGYLDAVRGRPAVPPRGRVA